MQSKTKATDLKEAGPGQWVGMYADYLYSYAYSRINDAELAKDLVQETFLAALEGWEKFGRQSSEKTWLTGILKNKIYDVYRKKSRTLLHEPLSGDGQDADELFEGDTGHWKEGHYPVAFGIEQPDALEHKEFEGILKACMAKLPPLWSSVFRMKHIDEESGEDICERLDITASNFWVISHRAKVSLRDCLQKNWI